MVDLQKEFNKILDDEGSYILLIKPSKKIKCICWNDLSQSADSKCPICLGTGFTIKVERHISLSFTASVTESLPRLKRVAEPSSLTIDGKYFYLKTNSRVSQGDVIVEASFDKFGRPYGQFELFNVNQVSSFRLKNKIVYHRVACPESPINSDIKAFNLKKMAGKINYYPIYKESYS